MPDKRWTPDQLHAIEARGGTVLVSAAAGSGKTAVLVERVTGRILDPVCPVDADRMLVVTFSNAAALEMKQRLQARIGALLAENPTDARLQRQQMLLERAQISTIHSFCLELIRGGFQQLGIAANTRIGDEKELEVIRLDCAAQVIEEMYAGETGETFGKMVELVSTARDDKRVFTLLFDLYDFIRAHPFYHSWLEEKLELYDANIPVAETVWGRCVLDYARESVCYLQTQLARALEIVQQDAAMEKAYAPALSDDLRQVVTLAKTIQTGGWDEICAMLDSLGKQRLGGLRGDCPDKERVKGMREEVWKLLEGLRDDIFCATTVQFSQDIEHLRPIVQVLFLLAKRFDWRFTETKRQRMLMDFSDLEQFAIALLTERTADGYRPTALAASVQRRYDEVLIDEFQDVNAAQEIIFRAVSRQETNLFLVGDVKQSIYRFRQACPALFLEKKKRYLPYDGQHWPAKIILGQNFRSAPEVTAGINLFFAMLMSEKIGEIDYNEEEALKPGAVFPASGGRGCELVLLEPGEQTAAEREAAYVARRIAQMLDEGFSVAQGDEMRVARPGDFCILMRSPSAKAEIYRQALVKEGVPVWSEPRGRFLCSKEVAPVVSLLRVLVNPLLDIELAATMHSPLFSFSADELSQIRQSAPNAPLYAAVQVKAAMGESHCLSFLSELSNLRQFSCNAAADTLIRHIYETTDYPAKVLVMRMGQARHANLMLLVHYAENYHAGGYLGAAGLVRFIDRLCERGGDFAPAVSQTDQLDAVRVMSIHRSKGLEFPVVFLCDCAKAFNREDLRGATLLHADMGFTCVRRDYERMTQFPTLPLQAAKLELERSMLSEELRILYVAMTRAKERLVMTACLKKSQERLAAAVYETDAKGKLSPGVTRSAGSYLDWLMMAAARHPAAAELLGERALAPRPEWIHVPLALTVVQEQQQQQAEQLPSSPLPLPDQSLCAALNERLQFVYPFAAQVHTPTKLAVSQISKGTRAAEHRFSRRPIFLEKDGLTAVQKGNAMHLFMQFSDYHAAARDLPAELDRLTRMGFLSKEQAAVMDRQKIVWFFEGKLAKRIFHAEKIYRELRFLVEAGEELLAPYTEWAAEKGKTAIQGVADCVFIENAHAVIVDYKTDRVHTMEELAERYRIQLSLYRSALEKSLGVPVKECLLYSFALGKEVAVELENPNRD